MSFVRFRIFVPARGAKPMNAIFALALFTFASPVSSQQRNTIASQKPVVSASTQPSPPRQTGSVTGKVVDQSGTQVVGAAVVLQQAGTEAAKADATTDEDGRFVFYGVPAGDFELSISFPGLTSQKLS